MKFGEGKDFKKKDIKVNATSTYEYPLMSTV